MSFSTIANLIRLKPAGPAAERQSGLPVADAAGRSLLARELRPNRMSASAPGGAVEAQTLLVGLDFGASRTRVLAVVPGMAEFYLRRSLPTTVARLLSEDGKTISPYLHFGDEAVGKGARFETIHPWQSGDIADPAMARELARHVRDQMRRSEAVACRAVVAEPLTLSVEGRHHFQQALRGLFEQVIFLPRPYLAALGLQQQLRADPQPGTPATPAVVVDLGAGSTELCRMTGKYPRPAELAGVGFGGDHVVALVREGLKQEYPAFQPGTELVRGWVENFGFVGEPGSSIVVNVPVDGAERQIVLTQSLRRGCEAWLAHVQQLIAAQLATDPANNGQPVNIYLTGGGSRLHRLAHVLTERLGRAGFSGLNVSVVEEPELSLAALGALHAARQVRADQWPRFALD